MKKTLPTPLIFVIALATAGCTQDVLRGQMTVYAPLATLSSDGVLREIAPGEYLVMANLSNGNLHLDIQSTTTIGSQIIVLLPKQTYTGLGTFTAQQIQQPWDIQLSSRVESKLGNPQTTNELCDNTNAIKDECSMLDPNLFAFSYGISGLCGPMHGQRDIVYQTRFDQRRLAMTMIDPLSAQTLAQAIALGPQSQDVVYRRQGECTMTAAIKQSALP